MFKKMTMLALLAMFSCLSTPAISAEQPGTTDTVFNRRFIYKLKPMMPYAQLAAMIGKPGRKVGEDKSSPPPKAMYHWDGRRKSTLDIKVAVGRVVDLTVTSPKRQRFSLGKNGDLIELD